MQSVRCPFQCAGESCKVEPTTQNIKYLDCLPVVNLILCRHKLTEHEGVRYGCDLCSAVFSASTNLKRHKLSKHEGVSYSFLDFKI